MLALLTPLALATLAMLGAPALAAQAPAPPPSVPGTLPVEPPPEAPADGLWRVRGEVGRPGPRAMLPATGARVTLHRVGSDTAHPLDSLRLGPDGRYAFTYRRTGADDAIYFVSATWAGITYFSTPLRGAVVTGQPAEITVFDTTSGRVPVTVRGRHVIISAPRADESRDIVEVYELTNDSSVTLVSGGGGAARATWSAIVPAEATNLRAGQGGDVSDDALSLKDGRALVFAPLAPGLKQLSYAYTLPRAAFPLSIPLERATEVLEVLVQDSASTVSGAGLREQPPVTVGGGVMRRYLAQNVAATAVVRVDLPARTGSFRALFVAVVVTLVAAAMLLGLTRALSRRRGAAAVTVDAPSAANRLAREIAALDAAFAAQAAPPPDARAAYAARRAELKAQLAALLGAAG